MFQHSSAKIAQIQRVNATNMSTLTVGAQRPGAQQSQDIKKKGWMENKGYEKKNRELKWENGRQSEKNCEGGKPVSTAEL